MSDQAAFIVAVHRRLEAWVGTELTIQESITDQDYDRHGTSTVCFRLQLTNVCWRISGARMMLSGIGDSGYEFGTRGSAGTLADCTIEVIEQLGRAATGTQIQRRTQISITP